MASTTVYIGCTWCYNA